MNSTFEENMLQVTSDSAEIRNTLNRLRHDNVSRQLSKKLQQLEADLGTILSNCISMDRKQVRDDNSEVIVHRIRRCLDISEKVHVQIDKVRKSRNGRGATPLQFQRLVTYWSELEKHINEIGRRK